MKEPILEEYGLNISSFSKHREYINNLIDLRKSLSFSFWKYLFILPLPTLAILYFIFDANIILAIFLSFFTLLFFETIRDYFNKNSSDYTEVQTRLLNYEKESRVGDFQSALFEYCNKEIENYYKFYVFRKRCGREGGLHLAHLIKEKGNILNFIFNSSGSYHSGYNEYLGKRFSIYPNSIVGESNYFKFTDIINSITGKILIAKKDNNLSFDKTDNTKGITQTNDISKKIAEEIYKKAQTPIINSNNDNSEEFSNNIKSDIEPVKSNKEIGASEINNNESKGFWANIMNDVRSEIEEANNPKSEIKDIINTINTESPEKKYSSPRKIDWENINKHKAITGLRGEEIVVEIEKNYLRSINREDLSEKVKHTSIDGDGSGYDILSFFPDGQEKYIEVKSSKNSNSNSFNISSNELDFMKRNQYNYQIYRMFNVNENDEAPTLRVHTANDILSFKKITPVQYLVKME